MPLSPGTTEEMAASFTIIKITKRMGKDKSFVECCRTAGSTAVMSDIRKYNT